MTDTQTLLHDIRANIAKVVVGKQDAVDLILAALIAGGHVLIEDVPGVGKTTMVRALAHSLDLSFRRIQFTPDVMPSDVTGFNMIDLATGTPRHVEGAVMRQLILADEINRTGPKTQSALLEVMQEGQVTVDGETRLVPQPFMVLATQNPLGLTGTYPLPEAQLDRFLLCVKMGYPDMDEEMRILARAGQGLAPDDLTPVADAESILALRKACAEVTCSPAVQQYIVRIAKATREDRNITLGASPRASLMLMQASMARALMQGRDYVLPDDVQFMAVPVLAHRIRLQAQAGYQQLTAESVLRTIVGSLRVPTGL